MCNYCIQLKVSYLPQCWAQEPVPFADWLLLTEKHVSAALSSIARVCTIVEAELSNKKPDWMLKCQSVIEVLYQDDVLFGAHLCVAFCLIQLLEAPTARNDQEMVATHGNASFRASI